MFRDLYDILHFTIQIIQHLVIINKKQTLTIIQRTEQVK